METWNDKIYKIIEQSNRPFITLKEIYEKIKQDKLVTKYHLEPWKPGKQPRYECWTRRCLTKLINEKRIKRVATGKYTRM